MSLGSNMKAEWDYVQGAIDVTIRLNEATEPCSTGKWVFDGAFQMGVAEGKKDDFPAHRFFTFSSL